MFEVSWHELAKYEIRSMIHHMCTLDVCQDAYIKLNPNPASEKRWVQLMDKSCASLYVC